MKRRLDGSNGKKIKSSSRFEEEKQQSWSNEEDQRLRTEASSETKNWRTICKRMNKAFSTRRRTAKECEQRWKYIGSQLTPSEELLILLAFYRGALQTVFEVLGRKVDVNEYISKLMDMARTKVKTKKDGEFMDIAPLKKLQILICTDLALNPDKDQTIDTEITDDDWLDLARSLINSKEKITREGLREFLIKAVTSIEGKVEEIANTKVGFEDIMHERKEVQLRGIHIPIHMLNPLVISQFQNFYPSGFHPPPDNC